MNKAILIGAGVLGVVGIVLLVKKTSQASGNPGAQDQQSGLLDFLNSGFGYPYRPAAKPRVDNKNQPDSNASRVTLGPKDSSDMLKAAQDIGAAGSIVQSISDVWGTLDIGSWFGSEDSGLDSGDSMADFDWDNYFDDSADSVEWADSDYEWEDYSGTDETDYEYEVA